MHSGRLNFADQSWINRIFVDDLDWRWWENKPLYHVNSNGALSWSFWYGRKDCWLIVNSADIENHFSANQELSNIKKRTARCHQIQWYYACSFTVYLEVCKGLPHKNEEKLAVNELTCVRNFSTFKNINKLKCKKFLNCINKFGFMVFPNCRHFV